MQRKHLAIIVPVVLVGLIGAGSVMAGASSSDIPEPGPGDGKLSVAEVETFEAVRQQLIAAESSPGLIAVGDAKGNTIGYVATDELMTHVEVPMGAAPAKASLTLYDEAGQPIGTWTPPTAGWASGSGDGEKSG